MATSLTFEHPLNERIRTFLRLEYLFERIAYFLPRENPWMSRVAVEGILDILTIVTRADTKTALLKELERNRSALDQMRNGPGVDMEILRKTLTDIEQVTSALQQLNGPVGQTLRLDGFLNGVAKRNSLPGGTCNFDLPQYHHWLSQPLEPRRRRLNDWVRSLQPVNDAITLVLTLARTSNVPRQVTAAAGIYQETLNTQAQPQLVRVTLDDEDRIFPEVSGHKNYFNIRFMTMEKAGQSTPWQRDVDFLLTSCIF